MVQLLHEDLNHASSQSMIRTVTSEMASTLTTTMHVTVKDIQLWQKIRGERCTGCLRGKLTDHHRHKTTSANISYAPGEAAGGDVMFIETKNGDLMKPLLVTVDLSTQLGTVTTLRDRSMESMLEALIKILFFDREPSMIALNNVLQESMGIKLEPKSAG